MSQKNTPDTNEIIYRRVIFMMGGKGGGGKTTFGTSLVDYFMEKQIQLSIIDGDIENKKKGSLSHFYKEAQKIDVQTERGLDAICDQILKGDKRITFCDLGAGTGKDTFKWFEAMYEPLADVGVKFTAIGMVTTSVATVESVLEWGNHLRNRVNYIVVQNHRDGSQFDYLNASDQGKLFLKKSEAIVIDFEKRASDIQNELDNYGLSLRQYLTAKDVIDSEELKRTSTLIRSRGCFNRTMQEIAKAEKYLLI